MFKILANTILVLSLLSACGVKDAPKGLPPAAIQPGGALPEGIWLSQNKTVFLKASRNDFEQSSKFELTYTIVSKELLPLEKEIQFKVKYWMPSMPAMPVTPVVISPKENSQFLVTYDISMGGDWEFVLSFEKDGKEFDSFTYQVQVPE